MQRLRASFFSKVPKKINAFIYYYYSSTLKTDIVFFDNVFPIAELIVKLGLQDDEKAKKCLHKYNSSGENPLFVLLGSNPNTTAGHSMQEIADALVVCLAWHHVA